MERSVEMKANVVWKWKYNKDFFVNAYERLQYKDLPDESLLANIQKRIRLLDQIHKCSDEIAPYFQNNEAPDFPKDVDDESFLRFISDLLAVKEAKITVNIMTYNEERCIERCLDSVRQLADEIIVLDTGSTDRTVEIIRTKYPDVKLYQTEWTKDFSHGRNLMIDYSTHDWIFQIDADEYLVDDPLDLKQFVQIFDDFPAEPLVISPVIVNHDHSELHLSKRIFKKRSGLKYFGLIHEELRFDVGKRGTDLLHVMTSFRLNHDGYTPEVLEAKKKYERNKELLEKMVEIEPTNIRWYYFLAREKYYLQEPTKDIIDILNEGMQHKDSGLDLDHFHLACLVLLAAIYVEEEQPEMLGRVIQEIKANYPYCIDGLYYELSQKFKRNITELLEMSDNISRYLVTIDNPLSFIHSKGDHMYKLLGMVYFYRGDYKKAFKLFNKIADENELSELKLQMSKLKEELDHFLSGSCEGS